MGLFKKTTNWKKYKDKYWAKSAKKLVLQKVLSLTPYSEEIEQQKFESLLTLADLFRCNVEDVKDIFVNSIKELSYLDLIKIIESYNDNKAEESLRLKVKAEYTPSAIVQNWAIDIFEEKLCEPDFEPKKEEDLVPVYDTEGNIYETFRVKDKRWTKSNLSSTIFNDGEPLLKATSIEEWIDALDNRIPAYCYYNFDDINKNMGCIYNSIVIISSKSITPKGFCIPYKSDWINLLDLVHPKDNSSIFSIGNLVKNENYQFDINHINKIQVKPYGFLSGQNSTFTPVNDSTMFWTSFSIGNYGVEENHERIRLEVKSSDMFKDDRKKWLDAYKKEKVQEEKKRIEFLKTHTPTLSNIWIRKNELNIIHHERTYYDTELKELKIIKYSKSGYAYNGCYIRCVENYNTYEKMKLYNPIFLKFAKEENMPSNTFSEENKTESLKRMVSNTNMNLKEISEHHIKLLEKKTIQELKDIMMLIQEKKIEESLEFNISPDETASAFLEKLSQDYIAENNISFEQGEMKMKSNCIYCGKEFIQTSVLIDKDRLNCCSEECYKEMKKKFF